MERDAGFAVMTMADRSQWDEAVRSVPGWDVYWLAGYARFWEVNGDGEALLATVQEGRERLCQTFLRRRIPGTESPCWDLATPYGYGGLLGTPGAAGLVPQFQAGLAEYCRQSGVVSVFVRCHPLLQTHGMGLGPEAAAVPRGRTVYLDLATGPPAEGYSATVRNRIRRARRWGLHTRLTPAPTSLDGFLRLYRETMLRLGAAPFYHFPGQCFAVLEQELADHLLLAETLLEGQVIAAALFLYNDTYLHYHLGGSAAQWRSLSPNNLLFADVAEWGRDRGIRLMHLGGGMQPGDSLFRFKSGFSPLRALFWTGQQVYAPETYGHLTEAHQALYGAAGTDPDFFPAYRAPAKPELAERGQCGPWPE